MPAQILTALAKVFGTVVASAILPTLGRAKAGPAKLERALAATKQGVSIVTALHGEFGDDFLHALNHAIGSSAVGGISYEAATGDYIKLRPGKALESKFAILRDELNINLDRIDKIEKVSDDALLNYFRGSLSTWKRRYVQVLGPDDSSSEIFAAMDGLLDGTKRTWKDVVQTLARTSFGTVGTLMVISGALLATSTGVGVVTWISTWLFGVPWLSVGALVIPGAILVALSRYKFTTKHAITTCIKMAYRLLDQRYRGPPPRAARSKTRGQQPSLARSSSTSAVVTPLRTTKSAVRQARQRRGSGG